MNKIACSGCPIFWFCEITGALQNELDKRLLDHNAMLTKENARLKELAIDNGLSYGAGKNYIKGGRS